MTISDHGLGEQTAICGGSRSPLSVEWECGRVKNTGLVEDELRRSTETAGNTIAEEATA
jgi:hypothetical protein